MPRAPAQRYQWLALIAGPVASLVSFLLVYFTDPLNFGSRKPLAAIPAFLLAIVILLISHNVAAYRELERASNHSDEIYEAVKDYLHVTKVGSPETAMQYIVGRLPILQEVRNTSFNLRDQTDRAEDMFYDTDMYDALPHAIGEATLKGVRWKDIGDALAVKRLRATAQSAGKSTTRSPRYQYRLIQHNEPQINFTLLSYPDGTNEVLFNWDFRSFGQDPTVLLSRDRDIVQMFAVQFEHLWRRASPDHDKNAVRSTSQK